MDSEQMIVKDIFFYFLYLDCRENKQNEHWAEKLSVR